MQVTGAKAQPTETVGDWRVDWPARILVVMCVLNVNAVFNMTFDVGQTVSFIILIAVIPLLARTRRYAWSPPFRLLMAAIVSYLVFGMLFYDPAASIEPPSKYLQAYFNSILIIWALTGYVGSLAPGLRLARFLRFVRNSFLVSAASVWASPILYQFYVNLPFSAQQRMGGFFGNPNEAAMASVLAVALTLALPFEKRIVQLAALAVASGAVVLTFSKTGMSCLVIILVWHLFRSAKGLGLVLLPIGAIAAIVIIQDPHSVLQAIAENPALNLDSSQKGRILAVGQILSGEVDEKTTTGRTYIWGIVVERALNNFPFGSGLGSVHNVAGGIMENNAWQGAHNTFLMMWGEGGVVPLLFLVSAIIAAAVASLRYARGPIETTCLFVLAIDMMATHGALTARYHNVMLAVVLGLLAGTFRASARGESHRRTWNVEPVTMLARTR